MGRLHSLSAPPAGYANPTCGRHVAHHLSPTGLGAFFVLVDGSMAPAERKRVP